MAELVWERRNRSPVRRLHDGVELLGKWKALRFKGGGRAFRGICTDWLRKNLTTLHRLQGRVLYSLAPEDFQHTLDISTSSYLARYLGRAIRELVEHELSMYDLSGPLDRRVTNIL
jgi:hypothetical protein